MEKETLEEAAVKHATNPGMMAYVFPDKKESFIKGANWQAEQIPFIIEQYLETAFISKEQGYKNPKDWFEQLKKK